MKKTVVGYMFLGALICVSAIAIVLLDEPSQDDTYSKEDIAEREKIVISTCKIVQGQHEPTLDVMYFKIPSEFPGNIYLEKRNEIMAVSSGARFEPVYYKAQESCAEVSILTTDASISDGFFESDGFYIMYSEEAKLDEGLLDKLRASDRVQLRKFRRYGARQELEWHVRGKTFLATRVAPPENVGEAIFVYQQSGELLPTSRDLLEFAVDRVNFSQSFAPVGAGLDALVEAQLRPLTEQETTSDLEKNCSLENLRTMAWALMPLEISSVGIRAIQHDLTILGHYNGLVDGKLGPSTVAAIKSFQTEMNFEVDGQVSESQRLELRQRAAIERCRYKWTQYISDSERYKLFYPAAVFTEAAAMSNGKLELKSALVPKHALRVHVIHDSTRGQFESKFDQLSASAATSLPEFDFPLNRYVKKESSWFVVNGVRKASSLGAEYFYARYERADNGRIIGYEISVPFGQREKYKTIILAIAQSFEILK